METLIRPFAFQRWYLGALMDDVADEQMTAQPGTFINHPAWQIGHLAWAADSALALAGGVKSLDDAWSARFAPKTTPIADRSYYPPKSELMQILDERRQSLIAKCSTLSDDDWQRPHPIKPLEQMLPTLWNAMHFLLLTHESTHLGQIAAWRHAVGLPMALSKGDAA